MPFRIEEQSRAEYFRQRSDMLPNGAGRSSSQRPKRSSSEAVMAPGDDRALLSAKKKLVQSRLTSAFFTPTENPGTKSPWFRIPRDNESTAPDMEYSTSRTEPSTSEHEQRTNSQEVPLDSQASSMDLDLPPPPMNLYPPRRSNLPSSLPPPSLPSSRSNVNFSLVAEETRSILPDLLHQVSQGAPYGKLHRGLHALHQHRNPNLTPSPISVLNADTLDVALSLLSEPCSTEAGRKPPLMLNMANSCVGGGGWLKGAMAQEEALCYRTSLSFSLKRRFYPIPQLAGIYSPNVVVIRESIAAGHGLLELTKPEKLPIVSAVSVAAARDPDVERTVDGKERYAWDEDRQTMKEKIRVVMRIAGIERHRRIVLGALGCGAFGNPREEVARLWREVLEEREWKGWFERVVFAVLDMRGEGNWAAFEEELGGMTL